MIRAREDDARSPTLARLGLTVLGAVGWGYLVWHLALAWTGGRVP
jgi:hypothetical protein